MKDLTTTPNPPKCRGTGERGQADTKDAKENDLHPLPEGWVWTTLGESTNPTQKRVNPQNHPDLPYIGMENVEPQTMRLLGTVPAREMRSAADSFSPGDVLYGRLRPYLNKVVSPDFSGLCSTEFIIFRKAPHIHSRYLQFFLNSWDFVQFANSLNAGDRPRVKFEQLASYPFPVPPASEQERIVMRLEELLSDLEAGVAALERVRAGVKRYKASVLKAACEGKLFGKKGLENGELPEGWRWTTLVSLAADEKNAIVDGPFGSNLKLSEYIDDDVNGVPVLTTKNLKGNYSKGSIRYISKAKFQELKRSEVRGGDILVAKIGSCGKTGIYPVGMPSAIIPANLLKFTVHPEVNKMFVYYFLNSDVFKKELAEIITATAQPAFGLSKFKKLLAPVPPLEEQQLIVAEVDRRLESARAVEAAVDAGLKRAARLRQAVLRSAFEGRLIN